jgi:hypothetical protein
MATGKRLMPTIKLTVTISVMRFRALRVLKAVVMLVLLGAGLRGFVAALLACDD